MCLKDPLAALVQGSQVRKSGAVLLSTYCVLGALGGSPHVLLFIMVPLDWLLPPGAREVRMRGEGREGYLWGPCITPDRLPTTKARGEITLLSWNIRINSLTCIQT